MNQPNVFITNSQYPTQNYGVPGNTYGSTIPTQPMSFPNEGPYHNTYNPAPAPNIIASQYQNMQAYLQAQQIQICQKQIDELQQEKRFLEESLESEGRKFLMYKKAREGDIADSFIQNSQVASEKQDLERKCEAYEFKLKQKENNLKELEQKISQLNNFIEDLEHQLSQPGKVDVEALKKLRQQQEEENRKFYQTLEQQKQGEKELSKELKKAKELITEQENKLKIYIYQQSDIDQLKQENEKEHEHFLGARSEIANLNKKITYLKKESSDKDDQKFTVFQQLQERNSDNKILQTKITQLEFTIKQKDDEINQLKTIQDFLLKQVQSNESSINLTKTQTKNLQSDLQKMLKEQRENEEQRKKEAQQKNYEFEEQERKQKQDKIQKENQLRKINQKQQLQQGLVQANQHIKGALTTHGQLDVCFLVDVTGSMESYKEQTKQSIQKSLQIVKQACNRETNWAAICYQDFDELKQLKGKYHEHTFTKQSNQLEKWLDTIRCSGGGDGAEDIRGAMNQMCLMNWPSRFKIAILICDAPTHGKQYNGGCGDDHPNEDIRDAILKMIDSNIILIGLNFRKITTTMYTEIQKIYAEKNKQDLFLFADLQNLDINQAAVQMSKWIGQASQNATQTNKKETKSKNQVQRPNNVKDGAMEALCKENNFFNFETQPNVKTVEVQFSVLKIEIKEESFEKNIQTIRKIKVPEDYQVTNEGKWQCIRTDKPFAFGMMKDVFLMKKINQQNELYVIKTPIGSEPYKTKQEAIAECRSHLICQRLMKKFQDDLDTGLTEKGLKPGKSYPKVIYSDFLILEESTTKYWIAERFFQGEFVKYNNNFGFINDEITDLNKLAQAFSFYTYYISGFNYMISDVQGVGIYFTDPAVNTVEGFFDDTDMGEEGIKMYLVNYELKKDSLSREVLEIMDLYGQD